MSQKKKSKNKYKTYEWFIGIFYTVNGILLFSIIFSSIMIARVGYQWDFSAIGFEYFLSQFKFPMALSAGLLATITLTITIIKMKQNEINNDYLKDNILFNNYYTHMHEFLEFMQKLPVFKIFQASSSLPLQVVLMPLYKNFYGFNYKNFTARVNDSNVQRIVDFLAELNKSELNSATLQNANLNLVDLQEVSDMMDTSTTSIVEEISKYLSGLIQTQAIPKDVYEELTKLCWAASIYEGIIAFDEIPVSYLPNILSNFEKISIQLKVSIP